MGASIHNYLTDEEVQFVRAQLENMRQDGVYNPGKWFVSGFNRKPEALGLTPRNRMPARVTVKDITLRTAEQTPGIALSPLDRRRIAQALIEAGVRSIQLSVLGWNIPDEQIREEIRYIKSLNSQVEIEMGGPDNMDAIDRLTKLGVDCTRVTLPSNFAISPFYRGTVPQVSWEGRDWRREISPPKNLAEAVERNKRLIDHAHKRGLKMEADLTMLLYATEETVEGFARQMSNAGADYLMLADGPGGMGPHAVAAVVSIAKKAAPHTQIVVHLHNTFGLGVALDLAAVQAGAEVVEVSINGYGCAAGQVDLAQIVAVLEIMYGVDTGIQLDKLTELRRLGEDLTKVPVARNHPITGDEAFNWGGPDLITQELPVDPLIHWCIEPSVLGNKRKWEIDRTSGPWSMFDKLKELGIKAKTPDVEAILKAVHEELLLRKRSLTDGEIRSIALKTRPNIARGE